MWGKISRFIYKELKIDNLLLHMQSGKHGKNIQAQQFLR